MAKCLVRVPSLILRVCSECNGGQLFISFEVVRKMVHTHRNACIRRALEAKIAVIACISTMIRARNWCPLQLSVSV